LHRREGKERLGARNPEENQRVPKKQDQENGDRQEIEVELSLSPTVVVVVVVVVVIVVIPFFSFSSLVHNSFFINQFVNLLFYFLSPLLFFLDLFFVPLKKKTTSSQTANSNF